MLWASATSRWSRWTVVAMALGAIAASPSTTAEARVGAPQSARARSASAPLVPLPGHVHGLAQSRFDSGEAPDSLRLPALEIVFAKSSAQRQALAELLAAQQDLKSPQYHHWFTPTQYGSRFGASDVSRRSRSGWRRTA
jgi:hypothetical protein